MKHFCSFLFLCISISALVISLLNEEVKSSDINQAQEKYVNMLQHDPLYAWSGVDLEQMKHSIEYLEYSRKEILELDRYADDREETLGYLLYPLDFLRAMVDLESYRRDLVSGWDDKNALLYHGQLIKTIDLHEMYLDEYITHLEQQVHESEYLGLKYVYGEVDFSYMLAVFEVYRQNAFHARKKEVQRWSCITKSDSGCESVYKTHVLQKREKTFVDWSVTKKRPGLIIQQIRKELIPGEESDLEWYQLDTHKCYAQYDQLYVHGWMYQQKDSLVFFGDTVNDLIVHDMSAFEGISAYKKELQKRGAQQYLHQPSSSEYICPDIVQDNSRVLAMRGVMLGLSDFFEHIQKDQTQDTAQGPWQELYKQFVYTQEHPGVPEALVHNMVVDLQEILRMESEDSGNKLLPEQYQKLQELVLGYRLGTHGLETQVMRLVYNNNAIAGHVIYSDKELEDRWDFWNELMFIRNSPLLLLGGSNPSIVPDQNLSLQGDVQERVVPWLSSYNGGDMSSVSSEELTVQLIKGVQVGIDLVRSLPNRDYLYSNL